MVGKMNSLINTLLLKLLHPRISIKGLNSVHFGTEVILRNGGTLTIGKNVKTYKRVTFSSVGGNIIIGKNVSFNRNDILVCHNSICIGNNCILGPNIIIYDHDHQFNSKEIKRNEFNTSPIVIDNDCWIGANVIILRGTHIGEGCIIGAGTVIKGDIPAHSLVRGERKLIIEPIL